ncbi:hypothetical protein GpartN1_g6814.t1 [Galdieria partita]|uniref:Uncharacterized protein n=1 Tax=Galdieria partita TaxID=83374 RepID=A0A9C7UTN3_9RHOD|nr:hypothetical protein GpartN1_g6814.t1 [Galdieria partita]
MCAFAPVRLKSFFQNDVVEKSSEESLSVLRNGLVSSTGRLTESSALLRPQFFYWEWWLPPVAEEDNIVEAHRWTRCWKVAVLCVLSFIFFFYFWWKSLFLLGTIARLMTIVAVCILLFFLSNYSVLNTKAGFKSVELNDVKTESPSDYYRPVPQ